MCMRQFLYWFVYKQPENLTTWKSYSQVPVPKSGNKAEVNSIYDGCVLSAVTVACTMCEYYCSSSQTFEVKYNQT